MRISIKILFLILSHTLLVGFSKGYKTHLQKLGLKGKVKEVVNSTYEVETNSGEINKDERVNYIFSNGPFDILTGNGNSKLIFNENGSMLECKIYKIDGSLHYKVIYSYDKKGYLMEENLYDSIGEVKYKSKLKNHTIKNPYLSELVETYDSKGKLIITEEREFDDSGNIIESRTTYIETDGDKNSRISKMEYNSNKNLIREEKISVDRVIEYSYNEKDLLKSVAMYDSNMRIKDYGYKRYEYNDNGDIVEIETSINKKNYQYDYDENGNWIKRIQFDKGIPSFLTEREIEYYK